MPKVGTLGLDMMYRTCTVQTNHDFSSEADMVKKLRVSLALQPIATALFANSPFTEGKPNGFLSFRSEIWRDTDNARAGMLPFVFEDGMGFERYADYALDVPMYFIKRGDSYIDVVGQVVPRSSGRQAAVPGERATMSDWANHVSTIFPGGAAQALPRDARLRRRAVAAAAVAAGVLGRPALRRRLLDAALGHREGLDAPRSGRSCATTCRSSASRRRSATARCSISPGETLQLARKGLVRRKRLDRNGRDETRYLRPLQEIVARGITPAEEMLAKYHGPWNGSVDPIYDEYAY